MNNKVRLVVKRIAKMWSCSVKEQGNQFILHYQVLGQGTALMMAVEEALPNTDVKMRLYPTGGELTIDFGSIA